MKWNGLAWAFLTPFLTSVCLLSRQRDKRHTFASRLMRAGVDLRTVQELLGHKTISMTLRYSHLSPSHRAKAVGVLDGVHLVSTQGAKVAPMDAASGHQGGHQALCAGRGKGLSG